MYQAESHISSYGSLQTHLIQVRRLAYEEDTSYSPDYVTAQTYRFGWIWTLSDDYVKLSVF